MFLKTEKQFTYLENQVHAMNDALKILLQRSEERPGTAHRDNPPARTDATQIIPRNLHQETQEQPGTIDHSSMSVASTSSQSRTSMESIPIMSPEKKRIRKTTNNPIESLSDDQEKSAQYETGTPDDNDL